MTNKNILNRICFSIDSSLSMSHLQDSVIKLFDNQVQNLIELSKQLNQEIRVSVYTFNDTVKNLIFDVDVFRVKSLKGLYHPSGNTSLIDGSYIPITELSQTCQLYNENCFLVYIITDGEENASRKHTAADLTGLISSLPDNWTISSLVPSSQSKFLAVKYGFPSNNVEIWDTNNIEKLDKNIINATTSYVKQTSVGIRSCSNLFSINTANLKESVVKKNLKELKSSEYQIFPVTKKIAIKPFVESWTKDYISGSAYYELIKTEKIQRNKQIVVQNKLNGKVYGGAEGRKLLGLPDYEVKVNPIDHKDWIIYVQSSSVNRWLLPETNLLVMK